MANSAVPLRSLVRIQPVDERVIHVRHRNLRWEVSVDGRTRRMIDWLCTRERAIAHALELGRELVVMLGGSTQARIVVEGAEGWEGVMTPSFLI